MRICGKMDGAYNAVEIKYMTHVDYEYTKDDGEKIMLCELKMCDTDGDMWTIRNMYQQAAIEIVHEMAEKGYYVFDDDIDLVFDSAVSGSDDSDLYDLAGEDMDLAVIDGYDLDKDIPNYDISDEGSSDENQE